MIKKLITLWMVVPFILDGQHSIIPEPVTYQMRLSSFDFDPETYFLIHDGAESTDKMIAYFAEKIHMNDTRKGTKPIHIKMNERPVAELGEEGYELEVGFNGISLSANKVGGIFNGLQTLRQLVMTHAEDHFPVRAKIPGCYIKDYPRFGWRGLMLDVSRHFFTVDEVKGFIDLMAFYKLNTFHWHLTDDEGWRIEIKAFPKLTEIGAWRVERYGRFGDTRPYPQPGEKATYGGFYTQEQIKDVVKYAAARNITIVPEIDVPGHSMAALAAYPELSVNNEPKFVNPGSKFAEWYGGGKFEMLIENTLNPAEDQVYDFLDKVFTEVAALFPGKYIHMGGDECYKGYWEKDPAVQKFMKDNQLKDVHELQSYFVKRVEKIISSKGKTLIGWDEILEGGLADGAAVMSWRGMAGGIEAAKMGHQVVMSPTTFCYLDYTQGDHSLENPIYSDLSLYKTYQFEPVPDGVESKYILGGQGNLWTEVIPSIQFAYHMTYPRAISLAETLWSPRQKKSWEHFVWKLNDHFDYFDHVGISISKAMYEPIIQVKKGKGDLLEVSLDNHIPGIDIFYTIDNTYPVKYGERYNGPIQVPPGNLSLRAQSYLNGKPIGRMILLPREELINRSK